jgi:hypothetical protein
MRQPSSFILKTSLSSNKNEVIWRIPLKNIVAFSDFSILPTKNFCSIHFIAHKLWLLIF